jgi:hypothetical protein
MTLAILSRQAQFKRPLNADANLASAPDLSRVDKRQTGSSIENELHCCTYFLEILVFTLLSTPKFS